MDDPGAATASIGVLPLVTVSEEPGVTAEEVLSANEATIGNSFVVTVPSNTICIFVVVSSRTILIYIPIHIIVNAEISVEPSGPVSFPVSFFTYTPSVLAAIAHLSSGGVGIEESTSPT